MKNGNRRQFLKSSAIGAATIAVSGSVSGADDDLMKPAEEIVDTTLELVDPQYQEFAQQMVPQTLNEESLPILRDFVNSAPPIGHPDPVFDSHKVTGSDIEYFVYKPTEATTGDRPAILYIHGGGYVLGPAATMHGYCYDLAQRSGAIVASVEYSLAPEVSFPGPVEDCHAALVDLAVESKSLGIDPERISIMGHSAGGGLTASLAILARDKGEVAVKAQFPIYPMLDYRTGTAAAPVNNLYTGEFVWGRQTNRFGWESLRGDYKMDDERLGYFSPTHASSLAGLPPTFMIVGTLDLFLEEDAEYALQLSRAGVPVEFIMYPGAIHGFDQVPGTNLTSRMDADIEQAFRRLL